jgi:hypothetical protein
MTDDERMGLIDAELEQLRKDADVDLVKFVEMLVRGEAPDAEKMARVAIIALRQQRLTHALCRHLLGELSRLRDDLRAGRA